MRRPLLLLLPLFACGGPGLYEPCEEPGHCELPEGVEAECLDGGEGDVGFCTWACADDTDCSAPAEDESLVCASFESTEGKHCFPSCEDFDEDDPDACPPDFECRSTGGGNENRKVCFPG